MSDPQWQVIVHRRAEKALRRLPKDLLKRIWRTIRALEDDPFPTGYIKLKGHENMYRVRVGDWRIIYAVERDELIVLILEAAPRGNVYRDI